jgi:TonB family protein
MQRSTIAFFFLLIVIVLLIAHYNSRSSKEQMSPTAVAPQFTSTPGPSQPVAAQPSGSGQSNTGPAIAFAKVAPRIQPGVVLISVFEPSGKLLRTGSGLFVSDDGRIITTRSLLKGAAYGVAKSSDGRIDNISGILAESEEDDLAVLKAEPKNRVPFLTPAKETNTEEGKKIAVIASPLAKSKTGILEATLSKRRSEANREFLELSTAVPHDAVGAPVVNEHGDVIGLVTRESGTSAAVVRASSSMNLVLAQVAADTKAKWLVAADETPPTPAEGPAQKIPLANAPHPGRSRLIFSPAPQYPNSARSSAGLVRGSGRFRVTFAPSGQVKSVGVLRSTQNGALDHAAVDALRQWKAAPGEEWTLNVPITFQP